jgi:hypothetical protein
MGVSYYVYIGPFIEAPNPEKPSFKEYFGCPNKECRNYNKHFAEKFCASCGTQIKLLKVPDLVRQKFDVYDEFDDKLAALSHDYLPDEKKDVAIFYPNQGKFGVNFSAYDCEVMEMSQASIVDNTKRFVETHVKEIGRIKDVFGKAEVKWGVLAHAS